MEFDEKYYYPFLGRDPFHYSSYSPYRSIHLKVATI